jgi:D-alanine--D-alanine ligase
MVKLIQEIIKVSKKLQGINMIKVGVLMGGMSIEREVSFNSGRTICDHLDTQLFQVIPLFQTVHGDLYVLPWNFLCRGKIADFESRLDVQAEKICWDDLPNRIDFMYIAVHGQYAEDGRLQGMLELLKIPYLGSKLFASALGMDKQLHNNYLKNHGIVVPSGFGLSVQQVMANDQAYLDQELMRHAISFPCVVKPCAEGSSFGVFVVKNRQDLQHYLEKSAFISNGCGQSVLVEEKISGMEFTCIIITDESTGKLIALPPTEVLISSATDVFDYQQKYMPGAVHEKTPARCSKQALEKIQQTCIQAMQVIGFSNLARFDGFLTSDERVVIIDGNPLSGMGPATFLFRQAAELNISHTQLINHLIKTELKSYDMDTYKNVPLYDQQERLRVGVLFGGPSNEREISLESGRNVVYKLSPEKYEVIPLFMAKDTKIYQIDNRLLVCHSTQEISENVTSDMFVRWSDLSQLIDFVFIALHGSPGEDGIVQGALEMLQIPYNGSGVFASALCMDKFKTTQFLAHQGFDLPQALLLSYDEWVSKDEKLDLFLEKISYPCIVKPHDDGCSVMVTSPKNRQDVELALQEIFIHKNFALLEERIVGTELTVGVVGNDNPRSLAPSQTIVKGDLLSLEEKFLPGAGENQTPALLPHDAILLVQDTVRKVFIATRCSGYARIDCFYQSADQSITAQPRVVIIEINSLPGLTPATCIFHQAAEEGMRPMEFIDEIIMLGLQKHTKSKTISVDDALQVHNIL